MEVLDEEGRLFGTVNVVDALVVVFALAVVVAGAALVFGGDETDASGETMHVTLVSENTSATALEAGEVELGGLGGDATANVTDVHRTAGPRVYLRVALEGARTDGGFRFDGDPVRVGDRVVVADDTTRAATHLIERDVSPTFSTTTTPIAVEAKVHRSVADAVAAGDEVTVGPATVATVTDAEATARNDSYSRLRVTLELATRSVDGTPNYGGRPVRLGRELGVATDDYEFEGEVVERE